MSKKTMEFKAELKELLHLIINSLYSHKDIFLRELISNSADAIDKIRFDSLTHNELLEGDEEWKIKIIADKEKATLTISDNGIGMLIDEITDQLGTIAKSGTKNFVESLKKTNSNDYPDLIGQFGVGFYASFMVADKVTVISRRAGDRNNGVRWESDGKGEFSVEQVEKDKRGTDVILKLKDDCKNYLEEWEIRSIVKKYSDYVEHPVVMDVEREVPKPGEEDKEPPKQKREKKIVEETLNDRKAIWLKSKNEVTEEEYHKFYKHISRDWEDPLKVIHYNVEGRQEFKVLLYIPKKRSLDLFYKDLRNGLALYVRRIFIMDNCEKLIPEYMRFIKGVVDSSDLPLNVSREILQQDYQLENIKKNITTKVLNTLKDMKEKEYDKYCDFYKEFGVMIKEGTHIDFENKDKLQDLLLYESTKTENGKYTTFKDYVTNMPSDQKEIYYIIGDNRQHIEQSPYLEVFKEKGYEVLLMTDPIDGWVMSNMMEYNKKNFKAIDKGDVDVDKKAKKEKEKKEKEYKDLLEFMKNKLSNVKEVRLSTRLTDSACCLVADEYAMGAYMERVMRSLNQEVSKTERILELNPNHPLIELMQKLFEKDKNNSNIVIYAEMLYEQALLAEGSKIENQLLFTKRLNELMVKECSSLVQE
ncbi:MAG: molecular chaperone HtpG [bacterium]|nr:molecular chaperone HtpG [bacterium]